MRLGRLTMYAGGLGRLRESCVDVGVIGVVGWEG